METGHSIVSALAVVGVLTAFVVFVVSKAFFLATSRVGFLMVAANVLYETAAKKLKVSRWRVDVVLLPAVSLAAALLGGGWLGALAAVVMGLSWAGAQSVDLGWRAGDLASQHRGLAGRVPLPLPRLVVIVQGPITSRGRVSDLGAWPVGRSARFELLVLNPSLVVPQLPLHVTVSSDSDTVEVGLEEADRPCPDPGDLVRIPFMVSAARAGRGALLVVDVKHGDRVESRRLSISGVVAAERARPVSARIRRWKGGARAAFAWRGDQDLYDPATFQSEEGLRLSLGLARRFRMPSTLFLSGRLSLVEEEHRRFCEHFGWDRRSGEIPTFIRFLREEITVQSVLEFPVSTPRELAVEIGNHMYIHLGTHAAADPGNAWKSHAWIGEGRYGWHRGEPGDSFTEQRDNARTNSALIAETLGVQVTSWGVPGRVCDEHTSRAVEAAGLEIGTDTNASAFTNVLRLVRPHHPEGCERLVEITKKYPGDPNDAFKVAMLKYWLHRARREGGTFLFMAHHHLLLHEGWSCYHLTEEFLRHVLGDCDGDFYVGTVTAVGRYWRDVLSPRTRAVGVGVENGEVIVRNNGDHDLTGLPVEIELGSGGVFMELVDVPAGQAVVAFGPAKRISTDVGLAS